MTPSILCSKEQEDLNIHNIKMDECFTFDTNSKLYKTIYSNLHKKYIKNTFASFGWFQEVFLFIIAITVGIINNSWIIGILTFIGISFLLSYLIITPLALRKHKNTELPIEQINLLRKQIFNKFEILFLGKIFKKNKITGKIIDNEDFNVYVDIGDTDIQMYFTVGKLIYLKKIDIQDIIQFSTLKDETVYNSIKELEAEFYRKQQQRDLIEATEKITKPIFSNKVINVHNSQVDINEELKEKHENLNLLYIVLNNGERVILNNLNMDTVNLIEKKFIND